MAISHRFGLLSALAVVAHVASAAPADPPSDISAVRLSAPYMNPTLGQAVIIDFQIARPGSLDVRLLDRDGFVVRSLTSGEARDRGPVSVTWDGRDDHGQVVADEAYALKIDLRTENGASSYSPASATLHEVDAKTTSYDRQGGTLGYRLAKPSRVHLQAGSSRMDPKTKEWVGPCLKTLVNRSPRAAGSVIEYWDGYDQGGSFYVPDLPNFAVSLVATELPENAIITTGNSKMSFLDQAARRSGQSALSVNAAAPSRHGGLSTFEDVAPDLTIRPTAARWLADRKVWLVAESRLDLEVSLAGPSARVFERESGALMVFLDEQPISTGPVGPAPVSMSVRIPRSGGGDHRLTVNWVTANGPVAANSIVISGQAVPKVPASRAPTTQPGGQP